MKKRNYTIDMLKGFAIMLVVYVHLYYAGIGCLCYEAYNQIKFKLVER